MHILDNECSAEFKEQIKLNNMKYQLVPPHNHRQNIAEKAIQVFKAHFISISGGGGGEGSHSGGRGGGSCGESGGSGSGGGGGGVCGSLR
jgi:hypothetical protein